MRSTSGSQEPARPLSPAALARRRAHRRDLGDDAGWAARLADVLPARRPRRLVSDAMERGRSGWARFPEVLPGEPVFRTMGEGWGLFRVGEQSGWNRGPGAPRRLHADSPLPGRALGPVHEAGRAALDDDGPADPGGLRRLCAGGVPLRRRGPQPGRRFRLHRRAQRARQGPGADRRRALRRAAAGRGCRAGEGHPAPRGLGRPHRRGALLEPRAAATSSAGRTRSAPPAAAPTRSTSRRRASAATRTC